MSKSLTSVKYVLVWEKETIIPVSYTHLTVSSYKTRLALWEKTDGKSGKPKLVYENHAMPVFYRDVMYREGAEGKDEAYPVSYTHLW